MKTIALWLFLLLAAAMPATARQVTSLNAGWRFIRADVTGAQNPGFDAAAWQAVDLPHSYNAADAGDADYYRGPAWYRRDLDITPEGGERYILQFDGAALAADVYVNGQAIGRHEGGYAAFRFDITSALKAGGNVIAVRVDNTKVPEIAPLSGDFNIFGGLYRGVSLITISGAHIDLMDHGGPGVYATTATISADKAEIHVRDLIRNDGGATKATVRTRIVDADGKTVATATSTQTLAAGQSATVSASLTVRHPHLWAGRANPYRYSVVVEVGRDSVTVPLGIRTVGFVNGQFQLNGRPYRLYGVAMQHPVRKGKGTAVSDADIDEDMGIVADLGLTGMRLAHMQHPQRVYDDADRLGILLTTEVPLVDIIDPSGAFRANAVQQMQELVAQNYNHPSVALWGLGNEVHDTSAASNAVLAALQETAKTMDPSRPTVYSHCCVADDDPIAMHSDVVSYNRYFGWYGGDAKDLGPWADALHAKLPNRVFGVSEYGAGGSINDQEDPPSRPATTSYWHPEQYQAQYHETNWKQIAARPWLWSSFAWVAFDFPSHIRNEGDRPAINDKGLVSEDRKTKKDAYYWYQANWSDKAMLHITSQRYVARRLRTASVKVYSNQPEVRLVLNGEPLGPQAVVDHIATWAITLKDGDNRIEAFAGKDLHEAVTWRYGD